MWDKFSKAMTMHNFTVYYLLTQGNCKTRSYSKTTKLTETGALVTNLATNRRLEEGKIDLPAQRKNQKFSPDDASLRPKR